MITVLILPTSDVGPNQGAPIGATTAFGCVAQDPHDGDLTRLRYLSEGQEDHFGVDWSAIPERAVIVSIGIRYVVAGTQADDSFGRVGLSVAGVRYFAPTRLQSPHVYGMHDETWTANPATGGAWTRQALAQTHIFYSQGFMPAEPGYPRLTECVALASYEPPPERETASPISLGPSSEASGGGVIGPGRSLGNSAIGASRGPAGSGSGAGLLSHGWAMGQAAAGAATGAAAHSSSVIGSIARPSAAALTAVPSSRAPQAIPAPLNPLESDAI